MSGSTYEVMNEVDCVELHENEVLSRSALWRLIAPLMGFQGHFSDSTYAAWGAEGSSYLILKTFLNVSHLDGFNSIPASC